MDKTHLTRFLISDIKEELSLNRVAEGRHSEFVRFFKEHLNDDRYYCLSPMNPDRPANLRNAMGKCSRNYKAGGVSQYFVASTANIYGQTLPVVVQKIYPKTGAQFRMIDDYIVYLSKTAVDNL